MLYEHSKHNPLFYLCFDCLNDLFIFIASQNFYFDFCPKSARSHRNGLFYFFHMLIVWLESEQWQWTNCVKMVVFSQVTYTW